MKIYRFDFEVSIPTSQAGSRFATAALTGEASAVRVEVVHLPAGGLIGRHNVTARCLLAVVAGSGWASGAEKRRHHLRTGYAALWEVGEPQETGTGQGLTAVSIKGEFEVCATSVTREIVVADYDPVWPAWFQQVRDFVWPAVNDIASRIDHVGSTSVPGLAAKPIIDMDVVVASGDLIKPTIERLAGIGYRWRGDLGVAGRQAFAAPSEVPLPAHHLYLVVEDNKAHMDHWLLRDLLRSDREAKAAYERLKRHNLELADGDIDVYVAAKAGFVADLLTRARAERGLPAETYWVPEPGPQT